MVLETVSVADATLLAPPAPLQDKEYDVVALTAPVPCAPLIGNAPLQPPEAVQAVALLEFQVSVDVPPVAMTEGLTLNVAEGMTFTVAVAGALVPPGPVHVSEYAVAVLMPAVLWLPLLARAPLQPPEAVHAVALVELHVKLEVAPNATTVGAAANATVGTGRIVTVADAGAVVPPGPMQTIEYAVVAVNGPTL